MNQISTSPEETFALGGRIGANLRGGDIVLLSGGLGAGKTLLTKGIMAALKFDIDEVTSPSFTLVNIYEARLKVYHIDLYRLEAASDIAFDLGLEEVFEDKDAVVIIEWAERLGDYDFPTNPVLVDIKGNGDEPREISIPGANL
jgi:tRNA threonylcarbamoyladenosine biosynthesis protein TsaE